MVAVNLSAVKKSYGAVNVIRDVDIEIADGEFIALVGPSGCGKSTLLRMIAGLESVTEGEILFGDEPVNDLNPKERNVAMVFQSYALYPHMTVRENIGFNLKIAGIAKPEIDRRVSDAAAMLNLADLLDRRPSQLSGGQRQRVAMGRAVVRNPAVFLFDEPLSNLDAKLRVQMRAEIKLLHQKVGITAIYVTHDQIEAMTLADRIVVMDRGSIQQVGSPLDLYHNPKNMFVAGFIGSPAMNFIPATVRASGGNCRVEFADGQGIALPSSQTLHDGRSVVLGVRPEHLRLVSSQAELKSAVLMVEPTGAQTHVLIDFQGQNLVVVQEGEPTVSAGKDVSWTTDPKNIFVFDKETGMTLARPC